MRQTTHYLIPKFTAKTLGSAACGLLALAAQAAQAMDRLPAAGDGPEGKPEQILLFDFEEAKDVEPWRQRLARGSEWVKQSGDFASSGKHSLELFSPKGGHGEMFHAIVATPVTDWRGYGYLSMDIRNPADTDTTIAVSLGTGLNNYDSPSVWSGYKYVITVPAKSAATYAFDLAEADPFIARDKIDTIFVYNEYVPADISLHLDNVRLVRDEDALASSSPLRKESAQVGQLLRDRAVKDTREILGRCEPSPQVDELEERLQAMSGETGRGFLLYPQFHEQLNDLRTAAGRESMMQQWRKNTPFGNDRLLIAHAPATEKIMPAKEPSRLDFSGAIRVSAARNEKESFQIAVTPKDDRAVEKISVEAGDLQSASGEVFRKENLAIGVMGYVRTRKLPAYEVEYGKTWWPDPILEKMKSADVEAGIVQSFFVRLAIPKNQAPGEYRGEVRVLADGKALETIPLELTVYPFVMPDTPPLPVATTSREIEGALRPRDTHRVRDYVGREKYDREEKYREADFLADYYLDYNSLYAGRPDYDVLSHLHRQGRLGTFNLGYFSDAVNEEIGQVKDLSKLKERYDKAEELGLADHAYIYGFDEKPYTPELVAAVEEIKRVLPDSFILTTARSSDYGAGESTTKAVDGWVTLTSHYNAEAVRRAQEQGIQVWWYVCNWPMHPYANIFLEHDALEARLLMGAMARKYRPDGFLYYGTNIFRQNKPLQTDTPFTSWQPNSFDNWNGDGQWVYFGEDGRLIPSIRLENFRDGLEDYAYARILEGIADRYRAKSDRTETEQQWLAAADEALRVPDDLVESLTSYTDSTGTLYRWRNRMAGLIASSDDPDYNPWTGDFAIGQAGHKAKGKQK